MASEILSIPEERLQEVILVIRRGIFAGNSALKNDVSLDTAKFLLEWCDEEQEYLDGLQSD